MESRLQPVLGVICGDTGELLFVMDISLAFWFKFSGTFFPKQSCRAIKQKRNFNL